MNYRKIYESALMIESPVNKRCEKQLDIIKDPTKRAKLTDMLRQIEYRNISEEASSTGKYHPDFAHKPFGLSRHVKAVVAIVQAICTAFPHLDQDTLVIAALMHDSKKYIGDEKYTTKDHAEQAAKWLRSVGLNDEARLVAAHMGKWDAEKGVAPMPTKEDEKMLHLADYLASKTWLHVDFDSLDNIIENNNLIKR